MQHTQRDETQHEGQTRDASESFANLTTSLREPRLPESLAQTNAPLLEGEPFLETRLMNPVCMSVCVCVKLLLNVEHLLL